MPITPQTGPTQYQGSNGQTYGSWEAAAAASGPGYGGTSTTGGGGGGSGAGVTSVTKPPENDPYWKTPAGKLAKRWYDAHPGQGAAEYVASEQYAIDVAAVAAGWDGTNPFMPGDAKAFTGRSLADVQTAGGFSAMNPQEFEHYFGGLVTGEPESTSAFLKLNGIETGMGNPWAKSAEKLIQPATLAAMLQLYGGNTGNALGEQGVARTAKMVQDRFAGGHASYFNPEEGRAFLGTMADIADRKPSANDRGSVEEFLNRPGGDNAFEAFMDVQGMNLNPFFRFQGVREGLKNKLYNRYHQEAAGKPNSTYSRFLYEGL